MIDLEPMWLALAKYQPYADAGGHGDTWRKMCKQRTKRAAKAAWEDSRFVGGNVESAVNEAWAAVIAFADVEYRIAEVKITSGLAINKIRNAIKDCNQDETNDGR